MKPDNHKLDVISQQIGIDHRQATELFRRIRSAVEEGGQVIVQEFGTFYLQNNRARTRTNRGVVFQVPANQKIRLRGVCVDSTPAETLLRRAVIKRFLVPTIAFGVDFNPPMLIRLNFDDDGTVRGRFSSDFGETSGTPLGGTFTEIVEVENAVPGYQDVSIRLVNSDLFNQENENEELIGIGPLQIINGNALSLNDSIDIDPSQPVTIDQTQELIDFGPGRPTFFVEITYLFLDENLNSVEAGAPIQ